MARAPRKRETGGCENPVTEMALVLRADEYLDSQGREGEKHSVEGASCGNTSGWEGAGMGG